MTTKHSLWLGVLTFLLLAVLQSSGTMVRTFSNKTFQLAWFYKPPQDGNLDILARYFTTFIFTSRDEGVISGLRERGVTSPLLQYVRLDAIHDPCHGACPCRKEPYRNQVAWEPDDYCALSQQHPDWFLRDRHGNLIAISSSPDRYVWMDPGNLAWRAFWLERVRQSQERLGWDGVFLDNVEASLGKYKRHNVQPQDYPDEARLQTAVEGFLAYLQSSYFQPQGRPLLGNIIALHDSALWFRYLRHLDGAMEEAFAVGWGSEKFRSVEAWEEHLQRAEQTQKLGKRMLLVAQGAQHDLPRQAFALASYLLVADGAAAFRYSHHSAYHLPWLYDNYQLGLGEPLGQRFRKDHLWQRRFTKGLVSVDPVNHTATISTP